MSASLKFPKLPPGWNEESLISNDLYLRIYRKKSLVGGRLLFLVHGQAEQSDRYEHFPSFLQSCIDAMVCIDLPGHGKSKGIRGHIENFNEYSDAVLSGFKTAQEWFTSKSPLHKTFWFGHSLGGLISLGTLLKNSDLSIQAVFVSAVPLDLVIPVPRVKGAFAKWTEPILGKVKLWNELDAKLVSRDMDVVEYYSKNPLNHKFVTPRFFVHFMRSMEEVRNQRGPFAYNLAMGVPLADGIVSWKAQTAFFKHLKMSPGPPAKIKELILFPGYHHEIFNDLGKERPFVALENWFSRF